MSIHLNKPYKIVPTRYKRYEAHLSIPADRSVIIPLKSFGDEVCCDVRWEDNNGELKVLHNVVFVSENLSPLNNFLDDKLHEIWQHYYGGLN
jgi:hypothetical protein